MSNDRSPLELEIAWSRITSIAEEADANVMRTAFSSIIRDSHDYSCAIYDARGNLLVQPAFVTPGHLGGMSGAMKSLESYIPLENLHEGDVIITNDPWIMSGHLPDLMVICPVFWHSRLVAFAGCVFHHQDIGGRLGSDSREVFEEGLQIPPCFLYRHGKCNDELLGVIAANVRVPELVVNDVHSQVATVRFTASRIQKFLDEAGWESLEALADEIFERTETAIRKGIRDIPEGRYSSECRIETGSQDRTVKLCLQLEVKGDEIVADFSGTDPQIDLGINCVKNFTLAFCVFALKSVIAPFVPNNAGTLRPFSIRCPQGSILNARRPAAVVARTSTGHFIPELVYAALGQVVPERVLAQSGSVPLWWLTLSGRRRDNRAFVIGPLFSGGLGARSASDGISCLTFPGNIRNNPVEIIETDSPLIVEKREFIPDSGGAGRYRGGLGQEFSLRVPDDETAPVEPIVEFLVAGRLVFAANGLRGGRPGGLGSVTLDGKEIGWGQPYLLYPGSRIQYRTPGGGGYGPPCERPPELVAKEVMDGLVSERAAFEIYRVALEPRTFALDTAATNKLRAT